MRAALLTLLLAAVAGCAPTNPSHEPYTRPHVGDEPSPAAMQALNGEGERPLPFREELLEVIRVGNRADRWWWASQASLPKEKRIQTWRFGEARDQDGWTAESPYQYSPSLVVERYKTAISTLPESLRSLLTGTDAVPEQAQAPEFLLKVRETIRYLSRQRGRAIRMAEYWVNRDFMSPGVWMHLDWRILKSAQRDHAQIITALKLGQASAVDKILPLCVFSNWERTEESCRTEWSALLATPESAQTRFESLLSEVSFWKENRFKVRANQRVVSPVIDSENRLKLTLFSWNVGRELTAQLQQVLNRFWNTSDLSIEITPSLVDYDGALRVFLRPDVGTYVTSTRVSWDTIVMSDNVQLWVDDALYALTHELGHNLGFKDCYADFWDEREGAFIEYGLDPNYVMCLASVPHPDEQKEVIRVYREAL